MIELRGVTHRYARRSLFDGLLGRPEHAPVVDAVSLTIAPGETLCLVGQSGAGKSTVGRIAAGILAPSAGIVIGKPRVRMVFQDHAGSLSPRRRIGAMLADALTPDDGRTPADLLREVGLPPDFAERRPHEMSGGQRQRVAIARALAGLPDLLVLDEPTSALDVSTQVEILGLLRSVREAGRLSFLLITHDLSVAGRLADRIAVMRSGRVLETGPASRILAPGGATDPYTSALVQAWQRMAPPLPVQARTRVPACAAA
jgi:ABC-type dipeptide/oligopeptide/nickel transport system ATPase subunit